MAATAKVNCKCESTFQDARYGKGVRVANATQKKNDKQTEVRCTVCGTVRHVNNSQVKG